jgi:hypothetical protein
MAESQNFKELLHLLNHCLVDYLIVGGYAVMRYSEPRFTKDLDIWVGQFPGNSRSLWPWRVLALHFAMIGAQVTNRLPTQCHLLCGAGFRGAKLRLCVRASARTGVGNSSDKSP